MASRMLSSYRLLCSARHSTNSRAVSSTVQRHFTSHYRPAAFLSTRSSSFGSKQSRLSAPLAPLPTQQPPSLSSSAASAPLSQPQPAVNSGTASVYASTTYRRPSTAPLENVTQPTAVEYLMYLVVTIVSLLAGATVVHNIYKPDMTLPEIRVKEAGAQPASDSSPQSSAVEPVASSAAAAAPAIADKT